MSTTIERNRLIHRALLSPVLAGVNVVFGVIAGLIAATFHADLSNAVPLVNLTHGFDIAYGPWNRCTLRLYPSESLAMGKALKTDLISSGALYGSSPDDLSIYSHR